MTYKLHSQQCSCFRISILPIHTRHIRTILKLWGRPFCSSLLSFFLSVLLWKEFNLHSFIVKFHFSCSLHSRPVFNLAVNDCWMHVNIGYSTCIYSMPLVGSSEAAVCRFCLSISLHIVGYLMPNPVFTYYIKYMIHKNILLIHF